MPNSQVLSRCEAEENAVWAEFTNADLCMHIREYNDLLDKRCAESKIQSFLANHSYFFDRLRSYVPSPVYSKVRLGDEFEVDFVSFDVGSLGPEWYFLEIESPKQKAFTKSGNPSAALTHAMQQIRDWLSWVTENLHAAKKLMPHIEYPLGYVFLGRRHELDHASRGRLKRLCYDNRSSLRIHSLDWFADGPKSRIADAKRVGRETHWLAEAALTHRALRKGLPAYAQMHMDRFAASLMLPEQYP